MKGRRRRRKTVRAPAEWVEPLFADGAYELMIAAILLLDR